MKKAKFLTSNTVFSTVASNMQYLRRFFDLDRTSLAQELGWTTQKLINFELGIIEPTIKEMIAFARFFQVKPDDVISKAQMGNMQIEKNKRSDRLKYNSLPTTLSQLIGQTKDLHKMLEGFRSFQKLQIEQDNTTFNDLSKGDDPLQEMIGLLEEYIALNQRIIDSTKE